MPRHKVNKNLVTIPMELWTDPSFWENENQPGENEFVMVNGQRVLNTTTLNELGLSLTQNSVYSDPGEYNTMSPLELPSLAIPMRSSSPLPSEKISRSHAIKKSNHKRTAKKRVNSNNRFGFKKAFGTLTRGLKKLTGRSRRN